MSSVVNVLEENTRSRTGKHKRRVLFYVLRGKCEELKYDVVRKERVKGLYVVGEAFRESIRIPEDAVVVVLDVRLNSRGHVKGEVKVIDSKGEVLGEAVYRKLKVRFKYLIGEEVIDFVRCVFRKLRLPVKKYAVIYDRRG